jgi:glutaredoxin 3
MPLIDFYIDPKSISIFSKTSCGFCLKAKKLMSNNYSNIPLQVFELDNMNEGSSIAMELKRRTNQSTVPNIFVFGKHIGGYTELNNLHMSGALRQFVQEKNMVYSCEYCGKCSSTKNLSCGCFYGGFDEWGAPR